jgi:hypothetical protein
VRSDAFESSSDDLCLEGCPRARARPFNDDDARRATPPPVADDGGKESLSSIFPLVVAAFAAVVARRRVAGIVRRLQQAGGRARSNRRVRRDAMRMGIRDATRNERWRMDVRNE